MNKLFFRALAIAALSYTPLYGTLAYRRSVVPDQEEYYLRLWLSYAQRYRQLSDDPLNHVVELGPGSTLGAGIWALLTGCERYVAIDSVQLTDSGRNKAFLENSVAKLRAGEFDDLLQGFGMDPADMVREVEARLDGVRREIDALFAGQGQRLRYVAPGVAAGGPNAGADLVFSHAVLEHVEDIRAVSDSVHAMLRKGGVMAHCIDLTCHRTHDLWNGHWTYSRPVWRILRGARSYLINRHCAADHLAALAQSGFSLDVVERTRSGNTLSRSDLAEEFRRLSDDDLTTSGLTVAGKKQ